MLNRAEIIDKNFKDLVLRQQFPKDHCEISQTELTSYDLVDLFETQAISRLLDLRARELKKENLCYYTIGSSGHEGNAAVAFALRKTDMAFLHYRSGAFFIQRAKQQAGSTPLYDLLLSFMASQKDPISGGRHKVIGSKELFIPPQTSTIASHLPKAVGAALSISRAKDLNVDSELPSDSLILCSFGDASANHSTALGAINTAQWVSYQNLKLPLIFLCEDNGIGISVKTPQNWIQKNFSQRAGLNYVECDGLNLLSAFEGTQKAVRIAREHKRPVFLHMRTVRLMGHAGSDVESSYQSLQRIQEIEGQDPLLHSARILVENQILKPQDIIEIYESLRKRIFHISLQVVEQKPLENINDIALSITACQNKKKPTDLKSDDERAKVFDKEMSKLKVPQHMAKLINWGLTDLMLQYPSALIFGEDVAEKGGVYNVTEQLKKRFGSKRVFNSPLDEQSILGTAIGFAHNGFLPVPEIQFLAYLHNAEDQIRGEAATLAFFSQGLYTNPMVVRIAGLAYQKGFGGHFHNDNSLAVLRDIPGLVIAVPSNGLDAVKMLRTCFKLAHEQGRVCIFIEPIALYMTRDLHKPDDKAWTFTYPDTSETVPVSEIAIHGEDSKNVILTYGNGVYLSLQAQKILKDKMNIATQVIDLRWIAPIDYVALKKVLKKTKNLLFVEECRKTGSLAEAVIAQLATDFDHTLKMNILGASDCFIPLGPAATAGLPSVQSIIDHVLELVGENRS